MDAPPIPKPTETDRDRTIARWRRRAQTVRVLRVVVPGLIAAILIGLGVTVAVNTMKPALEQGRENNQPIRLINPHFQGRDDRGRSFVITAVTATRDPQEYSRVILDHPALVMDEQGPDPTRIVSQSGVFHEDTGRLEVSGGVRMSSSKETFQTESSQFDTKNGELVGSGPVQGSGALGEISAKSYAVTDKGDRMVFNGDVHTRIFPK
ncbi:MAG: LPS export ABC transporter periplasmic protein LptC [Alphaproteobacteria bacterium]|nr:LPS export ABC transporter periplasmic protein LptC [Alphaproteobacteria bacterium]